MLRSVHSVIDAGMKGSLNQRWCLRLLTLKIPTLKDRACLIYSPTAPESLDACYLRQDGPTIVKSHLRRDKRSSLTYVPIDRC